MDGDAKRIKNQKIEIIDISKLPFGDADQWDKLLCYFGIDLLDPAPPMKRAPRGALFIGREGARPFRT
jgi:hypothetical protein